MKDQEKNIAVSESTEQNDSSELKRLVMLPTKPFRHLDLFSGIGGFALAAKSIWKERYENVGFCEIDKFCQQVLRKNFGEDITIFNDVNNLRKEDINGTINLLTGGFPCQPHSVAGEMRGQDDPRWLYPEMSKAFDLFRPDWGIIENVPGLIKTAYDDIIDDLEEKGYATITYNIPAYAVGQKHKRERLWILAHAHSQRCEGGVKRVQETFREGFNTANLLAETLRSGWQGNYIPAPRICRAVDGIPNRVDRIKSLGNAIVPQIAMVLLAALKTVDDNLVELCGVT